MTRKVAGLGSNPDKLLKNIMKEGKEKTNVKSNPPDKRTAPPPPAMNLESHEVNEDRQYANYKEQINPQPTERWTYREYQYSGMPVDWIIMDNGNHWGVVGRKDMAIIICATFNAFIEQQHLIVRQNEIIEELKGSIKTHVMNAYYQGDQDGWIQLRDCEMAREYKNSQDYYDKNFGK